MESPSDPAIPLLGIYTKNPETTIQKNLHTPIFTAELFTIIKIWKQCKCPSVDEWIKKKQNCGKSIEWNTMQQKERRNSYLLRQHGWNWRLLCSEIKQASW